VRELQDARLHVSMAYMALYSVKAALGWCCSLVLRASHLEEKGQAQAHGGCGAMIVGLACGVAWLEIAALSLLRTPLAFLLQTNKGYMATSSCCRSLLFMCCSVHVGLLGWMLLPCLCCVHLLPSCFVIQLYGE
jgi:hypothetical protein